MYDITSYSLVTPPYSGVSGHASIQLFFQVSLCNKIPLKAPALECPCVYVPIYIYQTPLPRCKYPYMVYKMSFVSIGLCMPGYDT